MFSRSSLLAFCNLIIGRSFSRITTDFLTLGLEPLRLVPNISLYDTLLLKNYILAPNNLSSLTIPEIITKVVIIVDNKETPFLFNIKLSSYFMMVIQKNNDCSLLIRQIPNYP